MVLTPKEVLPKEIEELGRSGQRPTVLLVSSEQDVHQMVQEDFGESVELLQAWTQPQAREFFNAHHNISVIVVAACVGAIETIATIPNTLELIQTMWVLDPLGTYIGVAELKINREALRNVGCYKYVCDYDELSETIYQALSERSL